MDSAFAEDRERLFQRLSSEIKDARVIHAMDRVPRERFVPPESYPMAYKDLPLPIDYGQTISQPFIVAMMTEAAELKGDEKVLEVGTGSGYQAAILAELAQEVISVERHKGLLQTARQTLDMLGYRNIHLRQAEKTIGWEKEAPYDAIVVTAGAPKVPQPLLDQLAEGGRLVIPVGSRYEQKLLKITKWKGEPWTENLGGCRFVPLIGSDAWAGL